MERLAPVIETLAPSIYGSAALIAGAAVNRVRTSGERKISIPIRTPTFCPGCPHRDSSTVTKSIKKDFFESGLHENPLQQPAHGRPFMENRGAASMLQFEPNIGLMQDYSGMGLGGGTGSGIAPFIKNKQVVFLGDSTFFHSGMVAVSDSIKNHQDITYIILENKTTAMTGHQPTPGTNRDIINQKLLPGY